jgi:hypothetical protein
MRFGFVVAKSAFLLAYLDNFDGGKVRSDCTETDFLRSFGAGFRNEKRILATDIYTDETQILTE